LSEDISAQLTEFQAGYLLAGYRLEREVGAGGMAVVFQARDERLGRSVALKILSPAQASDSEFRRRFITESQAAAAVDDPNIIPVYEAGEADGVLFIAMRYVRGGDLRQVLEREGEQPPDRVADFVSQVASALDAAHAAGLVHRDVKPGNILVDTRPGRPDHVYLSDFGIVRRAASERLTRVGVNVGTPDYMAPEQISGQDVDGRADQYSLACVTVQLLTGAVPFVRDSLPALIYAHLSSPPPSLASRRSDLPATVDAIVAKAMAKTPEERYESCGDFADALREALGLASYRRRSSATAPPYPPPGTDETPEAVVRDHPDATTAPDPAPTPPTVAIVPAEGPEAAEAAVADRPSTADLETTGQPAESASEPGGLTAAANVKADAPEVPAPADSQHSVPLPFEITPPTSPTPSRRPSWPHRGKRPKRQSSAATSVPDAAGTADSQLAEERGATAWPDEQVGEPGPSMAATDHGADVRDLPASGQSRSAVADGAATPPAATGSEGLPAAAAAVAEDQRTGDPGTIVPSDEPGLSAATGTDVLAPVQADGQSGTTSPAEPVVAGDGVPAVAATTPAGPVVAGDGVPAVAATTPAGRQLAGDLVTTPGSGESADELPWLTVPGHGGDAAPPVQRPPRRRGPVSAWIRRYRLPVFALACAALAAAVTLPLISSSHAGSAAPSHSAGPSHSSGPSNSSGLAAPSTGLVSLGNLSANPTPVDVYLYQSGSARPQFVEHDIAYGTILPYQPVNVGDYSIKMRAAGSPASSNPVWSVGLTVRAGGAYTVVPLRASAQHGELKVLDNNLTTPKGKSFVRVIQADVNQGQVTFHCSCAAGAPGNITTDAAPGTVSPQVPIPAGTWTMTATGPSEKASLPVTLTAGTVHTEIVISKPGGGIEIVNLVDAVPSYRRVAVNLPSSGRSVPISSVAFSPSGGSLAIASAQICLWDIAAARCTTSFGSAAAYSLAFSPDGRTLAVGDYSGLTDLWSVATSSQTANLATPTSSGAFSVAFTHDGQTLAVGDINGSTYLWNVATRKASLTIRDPDTKGVSSVAFTRDGKILAAGDHNGHAYLWDVATGHLIFTLGDSGRKDVMSVAFSPDDRLLVAGDANGQTYLWQVATGRLMAKLRNPGGTGVISVACSPDNTTMAAGDNNGNIYVWNVNNGRLLTTLSDPNGAEIDSLAFSSNGQVLASGDQNGSVFLWYIK
jgi:serine/threonine protein kinase